MGWTAPHLYFFDPILRAPTLGCMLMGLSAAVVGVIVVIRRQALLGESLAHASYPGVILGMLGALALFGNGGESVPVALAVLFGAFVSSLLGLYFIEFLQRQLRIRYDSALCFVLAAFFGLGITLASRVQFTHTALYRQIQVYLYGQAATMRDVHVFLYAALALLVCITVIALYRDLQVLLLDKEFARAVGVRTRIIEPVIFTLIVAAVVIGVRCVGVVLMSAMLIAPAVTARQLSHRLWQVFGIAGLVGALCGFLGNYLSVELSHQLSAGLGRHLALPTGPMVVLVASVLCLMALFFAPQRGLVLRHLRVWLFKHRCCRENLIKSLWRLREREKIALSDVQCLQKGMPLSCWRARQQLMKEGHIVQRTDGSLQLTESGEREGARIVRLHRLWELYLVDVLGMGVERVHRSAEEIEHILTPELEERLSRILNDPSEDPHHQPIPPAEATKDAP
jgi:manganese/zinc/iron transport system permease protein